MNKNDYLIRLEIPADHAEVEYLVRESFWNVYRPECLEHYVLHCLRKDKDFVPELDFVMEKDGRIIGQNIFVKAEICADDGRHIPIMTMGPICIANDLKRKGYGNIDFYGKSGFTYASEYGIRYHGLPEDANASFFLCKELIPGYLDEVTGEYATPAGYFVDEAEAEEFDKQFPYKEKLKLPGQLA